MSHERFSHKPPYRASLFYPECALALPFTLPRTLERRMEEAKINIQYPTRNVE
jgi:hypothetical protein